jgi:hypothetical protein
MTRLLTTVYLAALLLVGCGSTNSIRLGAKLATTISLNEAEASVDEAEAVVDVAATTSAAIDPDAPIDPAVFRDLVVELVEDQWSGRDRVIYVTLVDELALMIATELSENDIDLGESGPYIDAAATGVKQGAELYILLITSE